MTLKYEDFGLDTIGFKKALKLLGITSVDDLILKAPELVKHVEEVSEILEEYDEEDDDDIPTEYQEIVKKYWKLSSEFYRMTFVFESIAYDEEYIENLQKERQKKEEAAIRESEAKQQLESLASDFKTIMSMDIERLPGLSEEDIEEMKSGDIFCVLHFMETSWNSKNKDGRRYAELQYRIKKACGMDLSNKNASCTYKIVNAEGIDAEEIEKCVNEYVGMGYRVMSANPRYLVMKK